MTPKAMQERLVRYADLRPCSNAFIDSHTPGSDRKENFTIIGPGVAENPEQYVHIRDSHGFNIGAARQPPGCTNSQHSHETAEVFVIHHGGFRFKTGEHGDAGFVDLAPGDVISIPSRAFRGFDTVGDQESFMFSVLGGDDPGRVTWAPYVFEAAAQYGLVLLANGSLVDTRKGERVPADVAPMPVTNVHDIAMLKQLSGSDIQACTVKRSALRAAPRGPFARLIGVEECPIIGGANPVEGMPAGSLNWPHGFHVRALNIAPGASIPRHLRIEEEVLLMHRGALQIDWAEGSLTLNSGDTMTVPKGLVRSYCNVGKLPAELYVVRGGDHPAAPQFA
jgi:mannose-6-phosphate isomerase-like protein (cupin superfamily)